MSKDIQPTLEGWDFVPGDVSVRIIRGQDGREKVQMRVDLGLLQMELDGRPDGTRPHGFESMLDYFEQRAAQPPKSGVSNDFQLSAEDCEELLREGVQYYYRYLSFFHLSRYELAERDTARNLRLFAFARKHGPTEQAIWQFDQYRPYVIMMNVRSRAIPAHEAKRFKDALKMIEGGIAAIGEFLEEHELQEQADDCLELSFLKRWREEIDRSRPLDQAEKLERQLQRAVRNEDYERAAKLRDELRRIGGPDLGGPVRGPKSETKE